MKAPDRQPRVWVLPNRNALGLAAVLAGMWYAGSSQANAAAYLLGFVLTGMAAVSALHAWANVRGVRLAAGPFPPAFADGNQLLRVTASAPAGTERCGITVRGVGGGPVLQFAEIGAVTGPAELAVPAARRSLSTSRGTAATRISGQTFSGQTSTCRGPWVGSPLNTRWFSTSVAWTGRKWRPVARGWVRPSRTPRSNSTRSRTA